MSLAAVQACPPEEELARLIDGALDDVRRARVLAHVESCEACGRIVALALPGDDDERVATVRALRPGERLGRFDVLSLLGAGAMGAVYEARDRELERKVAVKVVRPDHAMDSATLRERLRTEARALARVSSPHVVAVHDVGVAGDDVFIAMELVDGPTLRGWLADRARARRDILAMFLQAGEGLAAAHEAGVIHRDFKPDNVLVGRDGRVRVSDFGLARTRPVEIEGVGPVTGDGEATLATRTVAGTPAYMAPEQRDGTGASTRSDQYAFCLALAEAVLGKRPTPGEPLPADRRIGERLRKILARGLAGEPSARWPSMRDLLAALAPLASKRRVRAAITVGVTAALALGGGIAIGLARDDAATATCALDDAPAVWTDARRATVFAAIDAAAPTRAAALRATLDAGVTAWQDAWRGARDHACEDRAPAHLECLELERRRLDRFLGLVEDGAAGATDAAVRVVQAMPAPSTCAAAGLGAPPPPADERLRAMAQRLDGELADATALIWADQLEAARAPIDAVIAEASRNGLDAVRARALVARGRTNVVEMAQARSALREAAELALTIGDQLTTAEAWILLADRTGRDGDLPQTELLVGLATAVLQRLGGDPVRAAEAQLSLCWALERSGVDMSRAATTCAGARDAFVAAAGEDDLRVAVADERLGAIAYWEGRWDEAQRRFLAASDLRVRVLGDGEVVGDNAKSNLAHVLIELDRADEAEAILEALIARHPTFGHLHDGLTWARLRQGDYAGAADAATTCLEVCANEGARACQIWCSVGLGEAQLGLGALDEANAAFDAALRMGVDPPPRDLARVAFGRARIADARGDHARADAELERALSILSQPIDEGEGPTGALRATIVRWRDARAD